MAQQNLASIPKILVDAFNNRNIDQALELISDEAEWIDVPNQTLYRGKAGYREFEEEWGASFPDGKIEIIGVIVAEDSIVVEYVGRGTHSGPLEGPEGTIPPTGKQVQLPFCDVIHVKDGLVVRAHTYYDALTLLRQIVGEESEAA